MAFDSSELGGVLSIKRSGGQNRINCFFGIGIYCIHSNNTIANSTESFNRIRLNSGLYGGHHKSTSIRSEYRGASDRELRFLVMAEGCVVHDFDDFKHHSICDSDNSDVSALYCMAAEVQEEG